MKTIDLYEIFQNLLPKYKDDPANTKKTIATLGYMDEEEPSVSMVGSIAYQNKEYNDKLEYDNTLVRAKFMCNFIFAILRQRMKFEEYLPANVGKTSSIYVGDSDLNDLLSDIIHFVEVNKLDPFDYVEKFFCFMFDFEANTFSSFNITTIKFLFRTFFTNNKEGDSIKVKGFEYSMLQGSIITEKNIFECIKGLPNEDPIQLLNFNVNNDIMLSYHRSKQMFNFLISCEENV